VNGVAGVAGGNREEIEQAIKDAKGLDGALTVPMRLSEAGGHYSVEVAEGGGARRAFSCSGLRAPVRFISSAARMPAASSPIRMSSARSTSSAIGPARPQLSICRARHRTAKALSCWCKKGTPERPGAILAAAKTEGL